MAENTGWITFADDSPVVYGITTSWRRFTPAGGPQIVLTKDPTDPVISWDAVADADGQDVLAGRAAQSPGFRGRRSQLTDCLAEDQPGTIHERALSASRVPEYYLGRAVNCGGNGTSDNGGLGQVEGRDGEAAGTVTSHPKTGQTTPGRLIFCVRILSSVRGGLSCFAGCARIG